MHFISNLDIGFHFCKLLYLWYCNDLVKWYFEENSCSHLFKVLNVIIILLLWNFWHIHFQFSWLTNRVVHFALEFFFYNYSYYCSYIQYSFLICSIVILFCVLIAFFLRFFCMSRINIIKNKVYYWRLLKICRYIFSKQ